MTARFTFADACAVTQPHPDFQRLQTLRSGKLKLWGKGEVEELQRLAERWTDEELAAGAHVSRPVQSPKRRDWLSDADDQIGDY